MADKKIIIVDDEVDMVRLLTIELEIEGFEVSAAHDGQAGLELIRRLKPDLVLLDVMIPRMDGYEVLRAVKADPGIRHIPVIMLTAKGLMGDVCQGLEAGADDYIAKPFHPGLLVNRIRRILKQPGAVDLGKMRILIIEDNEIERRLWAAGLESIKCQVYKAEDGEKGVRLAQEVIPHLIVCDIMLPGMDGFAVLESLKQAEATRTIPVVMLTAKGAGDEIDKALALGAEDYIVKPVVTRLFLKKVQTILTRAGQ